MLKEKDGKEGFLLDSFKSSYTDDDIMQYIKKEHGVEIKVLDNYEKHL